MNKNMRNMQYEICKRLCTTSHALQHSSPTASKVNLKRGDHVGLLVKGDGSLIILLNGAPVCKGPRKAPARHSAVEHG